VDVLVVAAFAAEISPLGNPDRGELWEACIVGIGLVAATAGTMWSVRERGPRAVVAVGTCGAYEGSGLGIGDVVAARTVRLVDPSAVRGLTEYPESLSTQLSTDPHLLEELTRVGAHPADVATTLAVTVDDSVADEVARSTQCQVEHLEAFGVAVACAQSGVPFGAVLAVSNIVGRSARGEWLANHRACEANAASVVRRWLAARIG
jgi:nucleoside phosphorylase